MLSIRKQTYKNIEIIFFDDVSKDDSINRIKGFNEVKIIQNKIIEAKQKETALGYFVEDGRYWEKSNSFSTDEIDLLDALWSETVVIK